MTFSATMTMNASNSNLTLKEVQINVLLTKKNAQMQLQLVTSIPTSGLRLLTQTTIIQEELHIAAIVISMKQKL